jgi:hypothetical protein
MSETSTTINPYLQKLKTRDPSQPTKLTEPCFVGFVSSQGCHVFKNSASPKLGAPRNVFTALERRCPDHVEPDRWQRAVEDGRRFLAQWGEQAAALGWTAKDLFGLFPVPEKPHPTFNRLSRYDETGLCWLLEGRTVVALSSDTAVIRTATGATLKYRKDNKPALGPVGDSLDDFVA